MRRISLIALVVLAVIAVGVAVKFRPTTVHSPSNYQFNLKKVNYPVDCGDAFVILEPDYFGQLADVLRKLLRARALGFVFHEISEALCDCIQLVL